MAGKQIALAINGRFLAQPISGVQRYGRELIQAMDGVLLRAKRCAFSSVSVWVPELTGRRAAVRIENTENQANRPSQRAICGSSSSSPESVWAMLTKNESYQGSTLAAV